MEYEWLLIIVASSDFYSCSLLGLTFIFLIYSSYLINSIAEGVSGSMPGVGLFLK